MNEFGLADFTATAKQLRFQFPTIDSSTISLSLTPGHNLTIQLAPVSSVQSRKPVSIADCQHNTTQSGMTAVCKD